MVEMNPKRDWAKPHGHWEIVKANPEAVGLYTLGSLRELDFTPPPPDDGDYWGPWVYHVIDGVRLLYCEQQGYEIELDRIRGAEKLSAWLGHLCEKFWATAELLGWLVIAVDDLVGIEQEDGL